MAHTTTPVQAVGPSGPGALAGFEATCSCGLVMRSSMRTIIDQDVRDHARWHLISEGQQLRAQGLSLYAVATQLGVTKEWLRAYAGLR